jgi:3-hydroxyacyl-[acyl-carrier-protein] dehydratase
VILTEVMAQIELVSLGIYLLNNTINKPIAIALTSSAIDFLKPYFLMKSDCKFRKNIF